MYFSKNEQPIIETFYKSISDLTENDVISLVWETGEIKAIFDTCFDDFDEENENDEFTSFVFKQIDINGTAPVIVGDSNFFIINYHNFPKTIMLNGKQLN